MTKNVIFSPIIIYIFQDMQVYCRELPVSVLEIFEVGYSVRNVFTLSVPLAVLYSAFRALHIRCKSVVLAFYFHY